MEALDSLVHCASLPSAAQHDDIDGGSDHVDDGYDDLFRVGSILITILYLVHLIQRWQKSSGTLSTKLTFSGFRVYVL